MALARCVNWFNPLVHLAVQTLRIDQELACDAQVVAAHPTARRSYAEAMLKTQLAARPLPLGCYWPAQSAHPLAERIALLSRKTPGRGRRRVGAAAVAVLGLAGAWSAWAARPAEVVVQPAPVQISPSGAGRVAPVAAPAAPMPRREVRKARIAAEPPPATAADAQAGEDAAAPTRIAEAAPPPLPARKIFAVAGQSAVEPGSAVRVVASMTDADGVPLTTDLTAFGSQSRYRSGYYWRKGSRYALFTSVRQQGDRLWVTASLDRRFQPATTGSTVLGSGETGTIRLGDGQTVTVTPSIRPETPQEVAEGQRALRRAAGGSWQDLRASSVAG